MRKTAGVPIPILGYFSTGFMLEELGLVDGPFSFWFILGPVLALSVLCSVFTFMAKSWSWGVLLASSVIREFAYYTTRA